MTISVREFMELQRWIQVREYCDVAQSYLRAISDLLDEPIYDKEVQKAAKVIDTLRSRAIRELDAVIMIKEIKNE